MEITISCQIDPSTAFFSQTIWVPDGSEFTPEQIVEMLNDGTAYTSIQEGGEVVVVTQQGNRTIGKVIDVNNRMAYEEFTLDSQSEPSPSDAKDPSSTTG